MSIFFYLSGFSFTETDDLQWSRRREGIIFYSTLPLPPIHEHWDIYLQLCMWDDYHAFLIATLVFTRLLLDEIYQLIELPFHWLIDDAMFVCLLDELILDFCYSNSEMRNRWIWTRIDYHPCIAGEPTKQVSWSPHIMQELGKFDFKINIIPNGFEKYMSLILNNKPVFIDSFHVLH